MIHIPNHVSGTWVDEAYGIRSNKTIIDHAKPSLIKRIKYVVLSIFRELGFLLKLFFQMVTFDCFSISKKFKDLKSDPSDKKGLVVHFHGLNESPSVWNDRIQALVKEDVQIYAPYVPKKGHCELDHPELQPIYNTILEWAQNHPGKPVSFFGHSNGTRLALFMENELRKNAPGTPAQLFLIAGVAFGTSLIQIFTEMMRAERWNAFSAGMLTLVACEELSLGSFANKSLLEAARSSLDANGAKRHYEKFASPHDSMVLEIGSSLPILNPKNEANKMEKDFVLYGYGHGSIVDAHVSFQIKSCLDFIKQD